jgi:hypothetical protein
MSKSIRLSEKHGVNPSLAKCFCCGDDYGVILFGRMKEDKEAPRTVHMGYCKKCEDAMKEGGVFIIEARPSDKMEDRENPYRTGRLVCIKEEAFKRIINIEIPKKRICYMEIAAFDKLFGDTFVEKAKEGGDKE